MLGRARLMVGGGFSCLGNWFSGQGSTFMICQRVLEKLQFECKQSVKSMESGYGTFLINDHLCLVAVLHCLFQPGRVTGLQMTCSV